MSTTFEQSYAVANKLDCAAMQRVTAFHTAPLRPPGIFAATRQADALLAAQADFFHELAALPVSRRHYDTFVTLPCESCGSAECLAAPFAKIVRR